MVKFYDVTTEGGISAQCQKPLTVTKLYAASFMRLKSELGIGLDELEDKLFAEERAVEYDNCITITTRTYKNLIETLALYSKFKYATLYNLGVHGWYARIQKGGKTE